MGRSDEVPEEEIEKAAFQELVEASRQDDKDGTIRLSEGRPERD